MRVILAVLVGLAVVLSGPVLAQATPSKTLLCTTCHRPSSAVKLVVTRTRANRYLVTVSGGRGRSGLAFFRGKTKVYSTTRSSVFVVTVPGKTYRIFGVRSSTGSRKKDIVSH